MDKEFKELDKVRIKSKDVIGYIVYVSKAGTYDVEKDGNCGPVYFDILKEDLEHVE